MPNATIDKVQVEVEATAKGTSAVFTQLERQLATLKQALGGIDITQLQNVAKASRNLSVDTSGMTKAEKQISSSVDKIKQSLSGLQAYKNAALSGDASSLTTFERKVIHLQSDIDVLAEKLRQAGDTRMGDSIDTDQFQAYRDILAEVQEALNTTKADVESTVAAMNSEQPTIDGGEVESELDSISDRAKVAAKSLMQIAGATVKNALSSLKKNLTKIKDALHDMKNGASKAASMGFGKLLRYGFGIRSMYVLFRRLRKVIIESFGELQKSGAFIQETKSNIESLKASLTTLKFQFGAAFQPIFNAIAPALQTLINYLVKVMNIISAFTAKLMGKSTYSKAVATTGAIADNVGGAAKAAKELNKQLQGFDELNNLTSNNPSGGGGGGGASGDTSGATYVTESVEDVLGDFGKTLAEHIKNGDWEKVGEVISEKLTNAMNKIPWNDIYEKARGFGKGLADFLNGLISPELFGALGQTIGGAINTALNFLNSFGETFEWSEFGLSIATGINKWFETTDFALAGDTVHTWVAGILDAGIALLENTDFEQIGEKLADFLNNLQVADLASKLFKFGKKLIEAIAECIKGLWTNADLQTKIGLALVGLIAVANLSGLGAKLGSAIGAYLLENPILIGKATLAVGTFVVTFEGAKWVFGNIAEDFDKELASYYKNFSWSEFIETIMKPDGSGVDWAAIKKAWNDMMDDYFGPLFDEVSSWIKIGKDFVGGIKKGVDEGLATIGTWVNEKFNSIVTAVKNFFGIHSPSTVFAEIGKDCIAGLKEGFTNALSGIGEWLKTNVVDVIVNGLSAVKDFTINIIAKFVDGKGIEATKETLKSAWDNLTSGISEVKKEVQLTAENTYNNFKETWKAVKKKLTPKVRVELKNPKKKNKESVKSNIESWKKTLPKSLSLSIDVSSNLGNLKNWININIVKPINNAMGTVAEKTKTVWTPIKGLAKGGVADIPTIAMFGEAGAEAVVPLENNLGWLNKMSKMLVNEMSSLGSYKYNPTTPTVGFTGTVVAQPTGMASANENNEMLRRQNELLTEQNRLLSVIANKNVTISSSQVFNAVNVEARNYNNRTGNSPFVY